MDKFIIDRAFGVAIWIDVEKGVVQRCYNEEPKYIAKMNEKYQGKSITFLKKDYIERAMDGVYHNLLPESVVSLRQIVHAYKSKVRNINGLIQMNLKTTPPKREDEKSWEKLNGELKRLEDQRTEFEKAQYKAEAKIELEEERILTEHNFKI
jgi:vacuolar-type H+-ATPase subunit I/STV1